MFWISEQEIAEYNRAKQKPRTRWVALNIKGHGHFYIGAASDEEVYLKAVEACADLKLPRSAIENVR